MRNFNNIRLAKNNVDCYSKMSGLSLQNMFYLRNKCFPNCYMFANPKTDIENFFDTPSLLPQITEAYGKRSWWQKLTGKRNLEYVIYKTLEFGKNKESVGINIYLKKENLFARIEESVTESYILYTNNNIEELNKLIDLVKKSYKKPEPEKDNLFLVAQDQNGFLLNKYTINPPENFDIEKQYNDDFVGANAIIDTFIKNKEKSGLIILHGEKGTGKTTYIRNVISNNPTSKFVFVPANMIRLLGEPSFGNFLMSMKDSIIILEDCEDVIRTRKSSMSSSSAVSLLLNMGDGLLSDELNLKFICTFNENISNIDDALLRKGRLACKYEFKELETEKANKLLATLYKDRDPLPTTNKPMTLADIYNIDDESYTNERKKII